MQKISRTRRASQTWRVKGLARSTVLTFYFRANPAQIQTFERAEDIFWVEILGVNLVNQRSYQLNCILRRTVAWTGYPYRRIASTDLLVREQNVKFEGKIAVWEWGDSCRKISCWKRARVSLARVEYERTIAFRCSIQVEEKNWRAIATQRRPQFLNPASPRNFWRRLSLLE